MGIKQHKWNTGAKIMQVIEVTQTVGKGVQKDPVRIIKSYFTLDGIYLATDDCTEWGEGKKEAQ